MTTAAATSVVSSPGAALVVGSVSSAMQVSSWHGGASLRATRAGSMRSGGQRVSRGRFDPHGLGVVATRTPSAANTVRSTASSLGFLGSEGLPSSWRSGTCLQDRVAARSVILRRSWRPSARSNVAGDEAQTLRVGEALRSTTSVFRTLLGANPSRVDDVVTIEFLVAARSTSVSAASAGFFVGKPWRRSWRRRPVSWWKPASTRSAHDPLRLKTDSRATPVAEPVCAHSVHTRPPLRRQRRQASHINPARPSARGGIEPA